MRFKSIVLATLLTCVSMLILSGCVVTTYGVKYEGAPLWQPQTAEGVTDMYQHYRPFENPWGTPDQFLPNER